MLVECSMLSIPVKIRHSFTKRYIEGGVSLLREVSSKIFGFDKVDWILVFALKCSFFMSMHVCPTLLQSPCSKEKRFGKVCSVLIISQTVSASQQPN